MKKIIQILCLFLLVLPGKAQYHSVLWKITGNGLKEPSYLFGTMHTSDARVFGNVNRALPYFSSAKAYAMELDPEKAMDMSLLDKLMMGKDYSVKKLIPAKEYFFLDSVVQKQIGVPMMLMDNVQPVYISAILETFEMELSSDSSIDGNKDVMDLYLYNKAKEAKQKVIGIETVDEQLSALQSLSYEEQANMLTDEIHSLWQKSDEGKDVVKFYSEQNLDSLSNGESDMPAKLYKALVTDRNERMATRIAAFIQQQPTFIAIGALHLPMKGGVIELLRKKGFKVEPVN